MSSMISSSMLPDVRMASANSRCRGDMLVVSSRSFMPSTPLSGVRISWLMLARNSDLMRAASSAASRAAARRA